MLKTDRGQGAPDFVQGGGWINLSPGKTSLSLNELRGKVVLVDFWAYTCINCIRTLPYLKSWYQKYSDRGLVIVGVHTPEFEFEKDINNVRKAVRDFGILYPVMQDNKYATWNAYSNKYWPTEYLIDKTGIIRETHFGEGDYDQSEQNIQNLLKETGADLSGEKINNPVYSTQSQTPESYLGYNRIASVSSPERIIPDLATKYTIPVSVPNNTFAFEGKWTVGSECATPAPGAALVLNFSARSVYLVARPKTGTAKVKVSVDGKETRTVVVDSDKLYTLVQLDQPGRHLLKLEFLDANAELYAFTFG